MAVTIAKHCIPGRADNGLSELQHQLVYNQAPVRIANAPTGAGKSYAFQYAVQHCNHRVLFVVPTKRLCQNLAISLIENLIEDGDSSEKAQRRVAVWNAEETERLKKDGMVNVRAHRLRQIYQVDQVSEKGEIIFAVPEVVSALMLRRGLDTGIAGENLFSFLKCFDHIVFDEFHTIEPRGFGLAALFSLLSDKMRTRTAFAKISFLSATPLEIEPTLEKLGVSSDSIVNLEESIGDKGRTIHGDVTLHYSEVKDMVTLVKEQKERIQNYLKRGRKVLLIYNRLDHLKQQQDDMSELIKQLGLPPEQVLIINSIDDSQKSGESLQLFHSGRDRSPADYSLIIATSSVEMGITIKNMDLLLMEPGYRPMNFLQRYGRAARGNYKGDVIVRIDQEACDSKPWILVLKEWCDKQANSQVSIQDLTELLSRETRTKFKEIPKRIRSQTFGHLPTNAEYLAGAYWQEIMEHPTIKGESRKILLEYQPTVAKAISCWYRDIQKMEQDRVFGKTCKRWLSGFKAKVQILRTIDRPLRVQEGNGKFRTASEIWLRRATTLLDCHPIQEDEKGFYIQTDKVIEKFLLGKSKYEEYKVSLIFPYKQTVSPWPQEDLMRQWRNHIKKDPAAKRAWENYPESMKAVLQLTIATGLLVEVEDDIPMETSHCVL